MPGLAFTEYDAYAEAVRDVSVRMRMCSRQEAKWTLQYATFGSLGVQQAFEGGGSIAEGVNGSDAWSLSLVHCVLATTESQLQLLISPVAVDSCRHELLLAARELLASCQQFEGRHFDRWRYITKSTLDRAMGRADPSLSIAELAQQAGVPERTFRAAFQRSYGLSLQDYLRIQRLYEARHLLRSGCQDRTTVTQIAFGLGFWDLGFFANPPTICNPLELPIQRHANPT